MKKPVLQFAMLFFAAISAMAQAPQAFNYQGVARSTAGAPLVSVPIGLQITIHDGSSSGTVLYQETFATSTNAFGLYNASIGTGTVASGTFNTINWGSGPKYLEVAIDPLGGTSYVSVGANELLSVPYSLYAANSPSVSGTANYVPKFTGASAIGNSHIVDNGTTVGIDTTTPSSMAKLEVAGVGAYGVLPYYQAGIVADGGASQASGSGIYGEGGWRGVYGRNPGVATGVEAIGVLGRCEGSAYTGTGYGVKGEMAGTGGIVNYGVYGTASGTGNGIGGQATGTGAAGVFDGGTAGYGVIVKNGISGFNTTTPTNMSKVEVSGVGTYSVAPYYQAGVVADGTTTASASGVFGQGGWRGVFGYNNGSSSGTAAIGAQGTVAVGALYTIGYGVYGSATGVGPTNYGVYGTASGGTSTNYAGYFSGTLYATTATSSVKAFKIDDPRDPANKYLYHSSVESNEMMDLYKGHVTTDANGDATVTLPSYFNVLNKDFEYQLTCVGQFAQAIVSDEISGTQFKIKTDKPNVKVSWQVSGVRQDPAANTYRINDEVEKPASEKGTYLMPELYGYGPEKATGYMDNNKNANK